VKRTSSTTSWLAAGVVLLAALAAGGYFVRTALQPLPSAAPTPAAAATSAAPAAIPPVAAPVQHPIEQVETEPPAAAGSSPAPVLPALWDSDAAVLESLGHLAGPDAARLFLTPQVVTRIVATVDALPRHGGLSPATMPLTPPRGAFPIEEVDGRRVIAGANAQRLAPYMALAEHVEPAALAAWYVRFYPLFQEAYQQLGYPRGYFNDRLVIALDDLLATPLPAEPPALVHSGQYEVWADAGLEARSAGQKLLLRAGTANAARLMQRIRVFRAIVAGQALPERPVAVP